MSKEELIIGFFEKGYCCDLDEIKDTCLGLLKENQELKQKYLNSVTDYETTMTEKNKLETQQKEFINFLEDNWKQTQDIWYIKILQKYESIIGDDK